MESMVKLTIIVIIAEIMATFSAIVLENIIGIFIFALSMAIIFLSVVYFYRETEIQNDRDYKVFKDRLQRKLHVIISDEGEIQAVERMIDTYLGR